MRRPKEETEKNYFEFLKELKVALNYNPKLSLTKLCRKHKISNTVTTVIIKENLVRIENNKKYWNTIEPNIAMAKELIRKTGIHFRSYNLSRNVEIEFPENNTTWHNIEEAAEMVDKSSRTVRLALAKFRDSENGNKYFRYENYKNGQKKLQVSSLFLDDVYKSKKYSQEYYKPKKTTVKNQKKKTVKSSKKVELFWGLIKIEY